MSLPRSGDRAALRTLDPKCSDPNSAVSQRTVAQLVAKSPEFKADFLIMSTFLGLGHLVRCGLVAGVSPDTKFGGGRGGLRRCLSQRLSAASPPL